MQSQISYTDLLLVRDIAALLLILLWKVARRPR